MLTRLFCSAGIDSMMICPPTFGMYSVCAKLQNAKLVEVPLIAKNGFQLDLSSIMAQYNATVKIIFLCSPNNPTGNLINKKDIISLCENLHDQCIVVVDEAYVEFSDSESLATMINQYENLVILRTLSKAYGLAGARCGILLAQAEIAQSITKIIPPYPVPMNTSEIVFQTLTSKQNEIQKQIECIKLERARLFDILKTMSLVKTVYQSAANFLLFESDNAEQIMAECTKHGIILRKMKGKLGLENCIRVSIGLRDENNQFIAVLENMRSI
ncbi:MAG: hypothetical protein ACD_29C00414G0001 [uncultured bacterium]|nr:MAG: hypothetical protein ACD_29C00414G0001 [uncultured bacterium]